MSALKNKFVFVVCGAREHIDALHFSLTALKRFTACEIVVVTDTARNEIPVLHEQVLSVTAPPQLDHHQASIYLKTGLHQFLPKGFTYCYLDTDVVAISKETDAVFNQKQGAVTFGADHCSLRQFSPHAVRCNCAEQNKKDQQEIKELLKKFGHDPQITDPGLLQKQKRLQQKLEVIKHRKDELVLTAMRFLFSPGVFKLDKDNFYHPRQKYWTDSKGNPILYEIPNGVIKQVEKTSGWRWSKLKRRWTSPQGKDIALLECGHLKQAIADKFKLSIDERWQHWNGGVFLFDDSSHEFMEVWHQNTLSAFKDPYWKTRDQGTLIATAWQLNLQYSPLLSKKFNFIAYFYNPALMISDDKTSISDDAFVTLYEPAFVHVFDHFGVSGWEVWDWIENKLEGQKMKRELKGN